MSTPISPVIWQTVVWAHPSPLLGVATNGTIGWLIPTHIQIIYNRASLAPWSIFFFKALVPIARPSWRIYKFVCSFYQADSFEWGFILAYTLGSNGIGFPLSNKFGNTGFKRWTILLSLLQDLSEPLMYSYTLWISNRGQSFPHLPNPSGCRTLFLRKLRISLSTMFCETLVGKW